MSLSKSMARSQAVREMVHKAVAATGGRTGSYTGDGESSFRCKRQRLLVWTKTSVESAATGAVAQIAAAAAVGNGGGL